MDALKREFIARCSVSAKLAGHVFPDMAACEAALESRYGQSVLAIQGNNLFGMKQKQHPVYGTLNLPTREFQAGTGWVVIMAPFVQYPTLDDCFTDRMATLTRLAPIYPHYKAALEASDPETYITEVSKTWSTDPNRAASVLTIYRDYHSDLNQPA